MMAHTHNVRKTYVHTFQKVSVKCHKNQKPNENIYWRSIYSKCDCEFINTSFIKID